MNRPDPGSLAWVDGREVRAGDAQLPLASPAVLWGAGLFETVAVRAGRPVGLAEHLRRLEAGARATGIEIGRRDELGQASVRIAAAVEGSCGWVKIVVCAGGPIAVFGGAIDPSEIGRPVSAVLLPWRKSPLDPLCRVKTIAWTANALGLEKARAAGADEGIWLNTRGHLAEGCASNLFVVGRTAVYTPGASDGILPGIERAAALRAAREGGCRVHEGKVRLVRLERAREAFLTSSVRGIRPLIRWNGRPVGSGEPGPVTRSIARLVEERRRESGGTDDPRSA